MQSRIFNMNMKRKISGVLRVVPAVVLALALRTFAGCDFMGPWPESGDGDYWDPPPPPPPPEHEQSVMIGTYPLYLFEEIVGFQPAYHRVVGMSVLTTTYDSVQIGGTVSIWGQEIDVEGIHTAYNSSTESITLQNYDSTLRISATLWVGGSPTHVLRGDGEFSLYDYSVADTALRRLVLRIASVYEPFVFDTSSWELANSFTGDHFLLHSDDTPSTYHPTTVQYDTLGLLQITSQNLNRFEGSISIYSKTYAVTGEWTESFSFSDIAQYSDFVTIRIDATVILEYFNPSKEFFYGRLIFYSVDHPYHIQTSSEYVWIMRTREQQHP